MKAPLPPNEVQRLETLRGYDVLDTPPESAFDDLTLLAAQICQVPIALVTLIDESRQWFKSKSPLAVALRCESAKGIILIRNLIVLSAAFCALTLLFAVFALPVAAADLLLFPSITSVHQSKADAELAAKKFVPAVDIFCATEFSQTRFLAGYLASSRRQDGLEFNSISAQWSMVLPL